MSICPCKDINISAASLSQRTIYSGVLRYATDASKDSQVLDYVSVFNPISEIRFEEFCAAAISVHQLEGIETWEHHARRAYELFEKDGNRPIMIEELASELGLSPSVPVHVVLQDWIRHSDGKLSFLGFVRLLHGASSRTFHKA
ncbi:CDPK-related kinase [Arachis hypogaea]|uniref:CDPK-related kinase n=1 Tax=Arachis hypogaea TaxID=3818 RepID=A0A6B9VAV1_ARAHY|nr:CDPK-related kinase [Arachis hypogaea]